MSTRFKSAVTVDETLQKTLQQAQEGQWAVVVRPPVDSTTDQREAAKDVFRAVHGEIDRVSFEIHQLPSGEIEFRSIVPSFDDAILLQNRIVAVIDAAVEIVRADLPLSAGDTVAGARLEYERDHILPLRTMKSHDDSPFDSYAHLIETMTEETESRCVIQFVITPVTYSWPFRWGYRLLQLWHEKIEPTWTSRWSRAPAPTLRPSRRKRKPSLTIASFVSLCMYAAWVGIGNNPLSALPSVQLLDAALPSKLGPLTIPANFSTPLFGPSSPIDPVGEMTYALMMIIAAGFYFAALFGDGLQRPQRRSGKSEGKRARSDDGTGTVSKAEKQTGEAIDQQQRDLGYRVNARVLTISDDARTANLYRNSLVTQFSNGWRNTATQQQLRGTTMGRFGHVHHRLGRFTKHVAGRKSTRTRWFWVQKMLFQGKRRKPIYCAPFEVASLAHWPDASAGGTGAIVYVNEENASLPPGRGEFEDQPQMTDSNTAGAIASDGGAQPDSEAETDETEAKDEADETTDEPADDYSNHRIDYD